MNCFKFLLKKIIGNIWRKCNFWGFKTSHCSTTGFQKNCPLLWPYKNKLEYFLVSFTSTQVKYLKIGLEPTWVEPLTGHYSNGRLLYLPVNIRLGWKWMVTANTLAYYVMPTIIDVTSFIVHGLGENGIGKQQALLNLDIWCRFNFFITLKVMTLKSKIRWLKNHEIKIFKVGNFFKDKYHNWSVKNLSNWQCGSIQIFWMVPWHSAWRHSGL